MKYIYDQEREKGMTLINWETKKESTKSDCSLENMKGVMSRERQQSAPGLKS